MSGSQSTRPVSAGLCLCEKVIVEANTGYVSLINCFDRLIVPGFPAKLSGIVVHAALTLGFGGFAARVIATRMPKEKALWEGTWRVEFHSPHQLHRNSWVIDSIRFPKAGWYQFELFIQGESITSAFLEVIAVEEDEE